MSAVVAARRPLAAAGYGRVVVGGPAVPTRLSEYALIVC